MRRLIITLGVFFAVHFGVAAQEVESSPLEVDNVQIDVKNSWVSPKGDTAYVELFLISYDKNPREFNLNTFASGVVDAEGKPYLYHSMAMGKVLVTLQAKQNYIHYLLEQDTPVLYRVVTTSWKKQWGKPKQVKLAFEDSTEPGKFLEVVVDL